MTYCELDLGDNYHSYNHRQSNPNIRADIADANRRISSINGDDSNTFPRRSYAKSAPASRSATPTRSGDARHACSA